MDLELTDEELGYEWKNVDIAVKTYKQYAYPESTQSISTSYMSLSEYGDCCIVIGVSRSPVEIILDNEYWDAHYFEAAIMAISEIGHIVIGIMLTIIVLIMVIHAVQG